MGAILVIEDDHDLKGLIERLLPKTNMRLIGGNPESPGILQRMVAGMGKGNSAQTLEELVREVLRTEVDTGNAGHIYESIIGRIERALIGIVLEEERGNQVRAAKILGINRNTLRKKMKDLHITTRVVSN